MKITLEFLKEKSACYRGINLFEEKYPEGGELEDVCKTALELNHFDYANWLLTRLMDKQQAVKYAIFAAELVLPIFEAKYPDDKRPRKAIEAAKECLKNPTEKNMLLLLLARSRVV